MAPPGDSHALWRGETENKIKNHTMHRRMKITYGAFFLSFSVLMEIICKFMRWMLHSRATIPLSSEILKEGGKVDEQGLVYLA